MKIFFNCLVHRDNHVIMDMINGINKFVENPIICLHVNRSFKAFDSGVLKRPNVYVNPNRYKFNKYDNKLSPLLSNHDYVTRKLKLKYDFEMFFYSQMGFIKGGVEDYLNGVDSSIWPPNISNSSPSLPYRWTKQSAWKSIQEFLRGIPCDYPYDEIRKLEPSDKTLVEGTGASYRIVNKVFDKLRSNKNICDFRDSGGLVCDEEFVIPSLIRKFSDLRKEKNPPMFSGFEPTTQKELVNSITLATSPRTMLKNNFFIGSQSSDNVYIFHRIPYDKTHKARKFYKEKVLS